MFGKRDNKDDTKPRQGFISKLRARLNRGDSWLTYDLANLAPGGKIDEDVLDDLEAGNITVAQAAARFESEAVAAAPFSMAASLLAAGIGWQWTLGQTQGPAKSNGPQERRRGGAKSGARLW